jgi:signal transduction histidine kinase
MGEIARNPTDDKELLRLAIHDLNNCIGVILASAELLELEMSDEKHRSRIAVLQEKAQEARRIVAELSSRVSD